MAEEKENIAQTIAALMSGQVPFHAMHDDNGDVVPGLMASRLPPEWTTALLDLEAHLGNPRRARGLYVAHSIASFASLYHGLSTGLSSRIYRRATLDQAGAPVDPIIEAVLNDDGVEIGGWRDYRVVLRLLRTPAWMRWVKLFNQKIPQVKLARLLEEHAHDITSPPGADLLKLALDLEATRSAQFKGTINLQTRDTGLTFVEKTETTIAVPREIVLTLMPYTHIDRSYPIPAFLRFELDEGKVVFTIEPKNWDMWLESIYDDLVADLEKALPDATWIDGPAPDQRQPSR